MGRLTTVDFFGHEISRLICGGNPLSGISHFSAEMDREMLTYYTMPRIQALLDECLRQGVNTFQTRGDRFQMRVYLEHRLGGGEMQWIAQTASEFADIPANIREIADYEPIAIYHHGTHTDNSWHGGRIDDVKDILHAIHDRGLPAGIGTHIPEVVEYIEERNWPVDFYMLSLYNLARGFKAAPAVDRRAYAEERFPSEDPPRMLALVRRLAKPCLVFKVMAAGRNCTTPEATRQAFQTVFDGIKPSDAAIVGMFPKYTEQVARNAAIVRDILQ